MENAQAKRTVSIVEYANLWRFVVARRGCLGFLISCLILRLSFEKTTGMQTASDL